MAYRITVGGRIGWMHASVPFGSVRISPEQLTVALPLRKVSFTPEEVDSIDIYRPFPYLVPYVRINHRKPGAPAVIHLTNLDGAARLLAQIRERGFVPRGAGL